MWRHRWTALRTDRPSAQVQRSPPATAAPRSSPLHALRTAGARHGSERRCGGGLPAALWPAPRCGAAGLDGGGLLWRGLQPRGGAGCTANAAPPRRTSFLRASWGAVGSPHARQGAGWGPETRSERRKPPSALAQRRRRVGAPSRRLLPAAACSWTKLLPASPYASPVPPCTHLCTRCARRAAAHGRRGGAEAVSGAPRGVDACRRDSGGI